MAKRGQNEGSVRKRADGSYEARYTGLDGKQHSVYAKTRQLVSAKLTRVLRDIQRGIAPPSEHQTLAQYMPGWLETKRYDLRESAWHRYEALTRLHILPALGRIQLTQLTPQDLNRLYASAIKSGLSTTTAHYLHRTLHVALADAVKADLIPRNVADLDSPPRKAEYTAKPYTPEQARSFLAAIADDRFQALYLIAITTGMRQGELLALTWDMVDMDHSMLNVRATHARFGGRFVVTPPKTKAGIRAVALNEPSIRALRAHRARQNEERLALGAAWENPALVFPDEAGRRIAGPTFYRQRFLKLLERADLPLIHFHDLRHTVGTLLLLLGIDTKIVSGMLGHSSVTITQDLYQQVLPEMQRKASDALGKLLGLDYNDEKEMPVP